jgi:hypothetical protein
VSGGDEFAPAPEQPSLTVSSTDVLPQRTGGSMLDLAVRCVYICVYVYMCVYVCIYVCVHVWMYVWLHV